MHLSLRDKTGCSAFLFSSNRTALSASSQRPDCKFALSAIRIAWMCRLPSPCSRLIADRAASFSRCSVNISALATSRAVSMPVSRPARSSHSSRREYSCIRCAARAPINAAMPAVALEDCAARADFSARANRPSRKFFIDSISARLPPISSRRARYSRTCSGKSAIFCTTRAAQ